jgi:hypothetical protein
MIEVPEAREFLQRYTDTFRDLLNTKYQVHKDEFPLYFGRPFEVSAFIVPRGMLVTYVTGASEFAIRVHSVSGLPKIRDPFARFYTNRHFRAASKNLQAEAEREIGFQLNLEKIIEEYERQQAEWMESQYLEDIKYEVGYFLKYLASAYDVKEASFRENVYTLFELLEQVTRFESRMQMFVDIRAESLILLHDQVLDDMHTSIFLAVHGKYGQAMSSLRRVLEASLRGIESDCRIVAHPETRPSDLEEWLQGNHLSFTGSGGVIERLFDESIDRMIVEFLREFRKCECASTWQLMKDLYRELSQYVHVEASSNRQIVLGFAEYNANLFDRWHRTWEKVILLIDLTFLLRLPGAFALASKAHNVGFPKFPSEELDFLRSFSGVS